MMKHARIVALILMTLVMSSCGQDTNSGGEATLEVWAEWDGELPEGSRFLLTVLNCPFTMPPAYDELGNIENGVASARIEGIPSGQWCLTAVIDVDPDDGLLPKPGYDITIVDLELDESMPVTLVAGVTTTVEVKLELRQEIQTDVVEAGDVVEDLEPDSGEGELPGPDDVWLQVIVDCPSCTSTAPVIFYGYAGEEMGMIPDLHNKFSQEIFFPGTWIIKDSGPITKETIEPGTYIVSGYQDLDDAGMMPEEGEPTTAPVIIELIAGEWNEVNLILE
jgi:hypothetical protein